MAVWFDWFNDDRYLIDSVSISAANGRSFMLVGLCFGCSVVRFHLVIGAGAFSDVYCHLLVGSFSWKWIIQSNFGLTAFGFFWLIIWFWWVWIIQHFGRFVAMWLRLDFGFWTALVVWLTIWFESSIGFWVEIGLVRLGLGRVSVESVSVWLDLSILGDLLRFWADWVEIWLNLSKFGQFFVKFAWKFGRLGRNLVGLVEVWSISYEIWLDFWTNEVGIWLNLPKLSRFFLWNLVGILADWVKIWLEFGCF